MAKAKKDDVSTMAAAPIDLALFDVGLESRTVSGFLANIGPFFSAARDIENRAVALRAEAKTWTLPTTPEEDEALVNNIRRVNAELKAATAHWEARTVFHALHKKLVAAFTRAERPLIEAQNTGNDLHNRFVANQREAARRLEEQRRREEYEREQTRQREEAARLEQAALDAEAASADLSQRELVFIGQMVRFGDGYDPRTAASAAGYKDPATMGPRLMTTPKILDAIQSAREADALRRQAAAVKAAPVAINDVTVKPDVTTSVGVTTSRVEVVDEEAFIRAAISGSYGVPASCLTFKQTGVNELGKTLGVLVERIPGLRYVSTTKVRG